jgi:hypothetical protein
VCQAVTIEDHDQQQDQGGEPGQSQRRLTHECHGGKSCDNDCAADDSCVDDSALSRH